MKPFFLPTLAIMLLASTLRAEDVQLGEGSRIRFADVTAGREVMTAADEYLRRLSPFDLSARMETDETVTLEQFKEHLAAQVLPWSEEQASQLRPILASVADQLAHWKLNFPETVLVVRIQRITLSSRVTRSVTYHGWRRRDRGLSFGPLPTVAVALGVENN